MDRKTYNHPGTPGTITYEIKRCIHVAECGRGLPGVFDSSRRPWIDPNAASADEIAAVVARCPTGALHFERADGAPAETVPSENRVSIAADGPLYVHGQVEVLSPEGEVVLSDTRVALCRCGASKNKPLCDNSHMEAKFQDAGDWDSGSLQSREADGPTLRVRCLPDGPLLFEGPFRLVGADGTAAAGARAAVCRCGASKNKPFCDGSHSLIDFKSA